MLVTYNIKLQKKNRIHNSSRSRLTLFAILLKSHEIDFDSISLVKVGSIPLQKIWIILMDNAMGSNFVWDSNLTSVTYYIIFITRALFLWNWLEKQVPLKDIYRQPFSKVWNTLALEPQYRKFSPISKMNSDHNCQKFN